MYSFSLLAPAARCYVCLCGGSAVALTSHHDQNRSISLNFDPIPSIYGASSPPDLPEDPYNRNAMDAMGRPAANSVTAQVGQARVVGRRICGNVPRQRIANILQRCKKEVAAEIHDEERESGMEAKWLGKVKKAVVADCPIGISEKYQSAYGNKPALLERRRQTGYESTAMDERHVVIKGETMRNETSSATASSIALSAPDAALVIPIKSLSLMRTPKAQTKSDLIYTTEGLLAASIAFEDDPDVEEMAIFQDEEAYEADLADDTADLLEISALMWLEIVERMDGDGSRGPYDKIPKSVDFFSVCLRAPDREFRHMCR
ncbi:hypothetical protein B0H13DRAFT_2481297 [Mycena leptocephala]|nr:hypothetical protein B0H13DRAFT_2481297 [Mycena leptocephala]